MEKAILKTLVYADIFDYPLTVYEIHKWLIGGKATLRQTEKTLEKLNQESRIKNQAGRYFLPGRIGLVAKRRRREKQSASYFKKAKVLTSILRIIPWVKLVGISGGLAMENADQNDDIDLFIITSKNKLWFSRLLIIGILDLVGVRRKAKMKSTRVAGKLCANILIEEDCLEQKNKDIYTAHEVLQMKVLWERDGLYNRYLMDNEWAFKFLPNWTTNLSSRRMSGSNKQKEMVNWIPAFAGMTMEKIAKWFQLKIMKKPEGMERIEDGALYFHPKDCRPKILSEYRQKTKKLSST